MVRAVVWGRLVKFYRWPRALWRRSQLPVARLAWGPDWIQNDFGHLVRILGADSGGEALIISDHLVAGLEYRHSSVRRRIFGVARATYLPYLGAIACNGAVVRESYGMSTLPPHPRLPDLDRAPAMDLNGVPCAPINNTTYYHFVVEELPAALRARQVGGQLTTLLPSDAPSYQFEALAAHGLAPRRVASPAQIANCIVVERGSESGWPRSDDIRLLRSLLPLGETLPYRHVYVSRSGSSRSLTNEMDLETLLGAAGVEVVRSEMMSWSEQVALFRETSLLIGPHGAGLTNLVLMPPGGKVFELVDRGYFNPCFEVLSNLSGQKHSILDIRNTPVREVAESILRSI